MTGPEVRYDEKADVLYLLARKGPISESREISPGLTIEFADDGGILGVEILRASRVLVDRVVASLHAKQAGAI